MHAFLYSICSLSSATIPPAASFLQNDSSCLDHPSSRNRCVQFCSRSRPAPISRTMRLLQQRRDSARSTHLCSCPACVQDWHCHYRGQRAFDNVFGIINDMIANLERKTEKCATEKAYCNEEFDEDIEVVTAVF